MVGGCLFPAEAFGPDAARGFGGEGQRVWFAMEAQGAGGGRGGERAVGGHAAGQVERLAVDDKAHRGLLEDGDHAPFGSDFGG